MPKAPLIQALSDQPPTVKRKKKQRVTMEDQLAMLWGLARGWTYDNIAKSLTMHRETVRRFHARVFQTPEIVLRCPGVYVDATKAGHFRCGFCPAIRKGETVMRRHVLSHVLPVERARDVTLDMSRRRFL